MHFPQARFRFYGSPRNYLQAVKDLLGGRFHAGTEAIGTLERCVAARLGVRHAIATSQGRVALYLAIRHLIKPGQNVVLSAYTIYDVVNMVLAAGGRPVFADVERDSGNIDPAEVERLIDDNTGAVLVTHLHGLAADMERITEICRRRGVPVVEDAAQAFGGTSQGRPLAGIGEAAILSFGRVKNINSFFGGMVVCNDDALAARIRAEMQDFAEEKVGKLVKRILHCLIADLITSPPLFPLLSFWIFRYGALKDIKQINKLVQTEDAARRRDVLPQGYKTRMSPMQARVVLQQLPDLDRNTAARIANAEQYHAALAGLNEIILPPRRQDGSHIYLAYPIQVENRWGMVKELMRNGNDLVIQHIGNTADLDCFREFRRDCPVARKVAGEVVLLPTYPGYEPKNIARMTAGIRAWLRKDGP